ncbi:cupin domain-containing protein [Enterovibrio sp. ZSDZ35]|uniref:Cupin domain-containing protein n=1 Tax=Enterovibrio qingdaonensis TaxID=2899818 RepID=A0ABT5QJS2_9GAMM|nr:cupin domain-containing protein [Enterovibrio sp. ZSDZ35]MDD1781114.1 cupin domain-containing protein [Enterovibrio sp. ZSDZ35]
MDIYYEIKSIKKAYLLLEIVMKISVIMALCFNFVAASTFAHGVEVPTDSKSLKIFKDVTSMQIASMNEPGVNAYFEDIVGSSDPNAPISCGIFKMEKGKPLVYTYDYDDSKIILDGHIYFSDGSQTVKGEKGDVLFFPKGSTITFSTDDSGLAYACGQRKLF